MNKWNPESILIIDDEPDICFLFERILRKRNIQTRFANNLAEAATLVENKQPSLVFLDNNLPDGKGVDFIPYLKLHYPFTKIIMITANDTPEDQYIAYSQGADEFLGKPLNLERINSALDKITRPVRDSQ